MASGGRFAKHTVRSPSSATLMPTCENLTTLILLLHLSTIFVTTYPQYLACPGILYKPVALDHRLATLERPFPLKTAERRFMDLKS
jgi:hypothetical protein